MNYVSAMDVALINRAPLANISLSSSSQVEAPIHLPAHFLMSMSPQPEEQQRHIIIGGDWINVPRPCHETPPFAHNPLDYCLGEPCLAVEFWGMKNDSTGWVGMMLITWAHKGHADSNSLELSWWISAENQDSSQWHKLRMSRPIHFHTLNFFS